MFIQLHESRLINFEIDEETKVKLEFVDHHEKTAYVLSSNMKTGKQKIIELRLDEYVILPNRVIDKIQRGQFKKINSVDLV